MVTKFIPLLFICISVNTITARSQAIKLQRPLIGDTVPAVVPLNMMNYELEMLRLGDFKGKWLILDFWATYCQACINAMPKLYGIQQRFQDELNIVLVTRENQEKVNNLLARSPVAKGTEFPFVVEDTLLHKLFPHKYIPHEIWIDPGGVVRAITDHHAVNSLNVRGMINGTVTSLPAKKDVEDQVESSGDHVLYKAVLSRIKDINSGRFGIKRDSANGANWYQRQVYSCYSKGANALQLYYRNYTMLVEGFGNGNVNPKRIDFEIKDSLLYDKYAKILIEKGRPAPHSMQFPYLNWMNGHEYAEEMRYDYEFKLPHALPTREFCKLVFEDLNRYFPIKARVEARRKQCWILKTDGSASERIKSKGGKWQARVTSDSIFMRNLPFSEFIRVLSGFKNTPPIVDETALDRSILVDIALHLSDFPGYDPRQGTIVNNPLHFATAKKELSKYGLDLAKGQRKVPVLVIYDE